MLLGRIYLSICGDSEFLNLNPNRYNILHGHKPQRPEKEGRKPPEIG